MPLPSLKQIGNWVNFWLHGFPREVTQETALGDASLTQMMQKGVMTTTAADVSLLSLSPGSQSPGS